MTCKDRLGMAMLLITHDMGVIAGHADRVNVMYAGRVVENADVRELFAAMHHPYTQALLASIPQLDQDANKALHAIPGLPPDLAHLPQGCRFASRCTRASDKCRAEEPPLSGPTPDHLFACWHPVDGPLALAEIGAEGPDAVSTGLLSRPTRRKRGRRHGRLVADAPLADPAETDAEREARSAVVAAGLAVTADGRLEVTARTVEVVPADGDGVAALLEIRNLVKEFPVTAGAVLSARWPASRRCRTCPSRSRPGRRSAWSESPAAVRPPSAR